MKINWYELKEKYPLAMKKFNEWIDNYKNEVNWDVLFGGVLSARVRSIPPKFHDIPFEMQSGIIFRFFREIDSEEFYAFDNEILSFIESKIQEIDKNNNTQSAENQ